MSTASNASRGGFRATPPAILHQIEDLGTGSTFQIGYRRVFTKDQLEQGFLAHAGVTVVNGAVTYEESFLPAPRKRWARWNVNGRLKVRKDLPKRTVSWSITSPNFGDGARNGYSTQTRSALAFRRELLHGRGYQILVSHDEQSKDSFIFTFVVDAVFPSGVEDHDIDLLMAVSLIGETVGYPQVITATQTAAEWAATQAVAWEILPVDHDGPLPEFDVVAQRSKLRTGRELPDTYRERYETMKNLAPREIYEGTSGFSRYMAFVFDEAVVLENFTYGNAAYVMFDDWKTLSQRTRPDLLSDPTANFIRIIHKNGWAKRVAAEVKAKVD
ncbi:hypothetical protein ACFY5D_16595 [Paeniglutamicibacter sp. NPDC012692]|uniref:hypothetical protein n=1 Tax=Paeniglutamicibacter sp. NPDC012692 TaxID=3364388 RepID=UPI00369CCB8A